MLAVGLAGVITVVVQKSKAPKAKAPDCPESNCQSRVAPAMRPRLRPEPRRPRAAMRLPARPSAAVDAGVPARAAMADAGAPAPKTTADAAVPAPRPRAVSAGPALPPGPKPVAEIVFRQRKARVTGEAKRALRAVVKTYGKKVTFKLTAYASEKSTPARSKQLARKRCKRARAALREAGARSRQVVCAQPIVRKTAGRVSDAQRVPAWRRVVIQVIP
jgi:hypothetical protein